jgi:16S rRNA (cytidine1402-2'-O)-methyltransferase
MEQPGRGRLVIVGTPIGNLEDFSPRARRALEQADAIFCEDTRVTGKLASRFGLNAPRISTPAPRERSRVPELMRRLGAGETVALVSDAGMPLLSDPGLELVNAAAEGGYTVQVVPGPSAPAAALAVSGISAVPHLFVGFLPARSGERRRFLEGLRCRQETLVWFESPHRLVQSLEDAASILGERPACVARELTKIHEEAARGLLGQLALLFRSRGAGRGEATVVVEGGPANEPALSESEIDGEIRAGLGGATPPRQLAREIARRSGRPAREIYARALALAREAGDGRRKAEES